MVFSDARRNLLALGADYLIYQALLHVRRDRDLNLVGIGAHGDVDAGASLNHRRILRCGVVGV